MRTRRRRFLNRSAEGDGVRERDGVLDRDAVLSESMPKKLGIRTIGRVNTDWARGGIIYCHRVRATGIAKGRRTVSRRDVYCGTSYNFGHVKVHRYQVACSLQPLQNIADICYGMDGGHPERRRNIAG